MAAALREPMVCCQVPTSRLGLAWSHAELDPAPPRACRLCVELGIARTFQDRRAEALALIELGVLASLEEGDAAREAALTEESLALWRELGDRWGLATALSVRGHRRRAQGNYEQAAEDLDFERAAVEKSKAVQVLDFVDPDEVDDRYFETPYYLTPGAGGDRPYALFREAIRESGKLAIAKIILRDAQHLAAIEVIGDALVLSMMRFADELVDVDERKATAEWLATLKERELRLLMSDCHDAEVIEMAKQELERRRADA